MDAVEGQLAMADYMTEAQMIALKKKQGLLGGGSPIMNGQPVVSVGGEPAIAPNNSGPSFPSITVPPYVRDRTFEGAIPRLWKESGEFYDPTKGSPIIEGPKEIIKKVDEYKKRVVDDPVYGDVYGDRYDRMNGPYPASPATELAPVNVPAEKPQDITPQPTPVAATDSPQPQSMEQAIAAYKAQLSGMYPAFDYNAQTPSEQALIADQEKDRQRTKLLAQLALSAGIAGAGGGPWESVGKGLAAAGGVYDDGFQRYQKALEGRAQREMSRREAQYKDDFKRTELAADMYSDNISAKQKQATEEKSNILKYFETTKPDIKPNDLGEVAPEQIDKWNEWNKRYRRFVTTGTFDAADE